MTENLLRVVHVIGPLRTGGAQTQLLGLVRAAHGVYWDATVVATSGGALEEEFQRLPCPFILLRRRGSPGLGRILRFRHLVQKGKFDLVHGNLWQSNAYARLAVVGRRNRPAVVISERNVEHERSSLKNLVDRVLAGATDAYVGNTEAVSGFIRREHPVGQASVVTIPNAVDRSLFRPPGSRHNAPTVRVGSIGRLDPEKGFDVLIEAVRSLTPRLALDVEIVGEGPSLDALRSAAQGLPVRFCGPRRPGRDIAEFLQSLDLFVLPSTFREGRPNAILEALAVGLPVVATDVEGMAEILQGSTLVPAGDSVALADAIEEAIRDPDSWAARSRPTAIDGFATLAAKYHQVFVHAIERATSIPGVRVD